MSIIVKPIAQSEKAHMLQERRNQYSFVVEDGANKIEIAKAVSDLYNVEVESVNTMRYGGGKKKMKHTTKGTNGEITWKMGGLPPPYADRIVIKMSVW